MRKEFLVGLFVFATASCWAKPDNSIIDKLKQTDVSVIDKELPSMSYEDWLKKTLGANASIEWEVDDCGEGGDREGPFPICVTAIVKFKEHGKATIFIGVGNTEKGIFGSPSVWDIYIEGVGSSRSFGDLHKLSDYLGEMEKEKNNTAPFLDKPLDELSAVSFAKNIDISAFIPSQSRQSLQHWFEALAGVRSGVSWQLDGCDQGAISMRLSANRDYRACVIAKFENENENVLIYINVGTYRKGLSASPKIARVQVYDKRSIRITAPTIDGLQAKLAEIRHMDYPNKESSHRAQ